MFTAKFYVDPTRKDTLMLRITNNRKKSELSMGFRLSQSELDSAENGTSGNIRLEKMLASWTMQIKDLMLELAERKETDKDVREIKGILQERLLGIGLERESKPESGNFVPYYSEHARMYDNRSTRESNEYTLSVMRKYCSGLDVMNFEDVTYSWLSDFEVWMKRQGMSQNTRKIHFGNIRTAMREAYKRELTEADPFRRFSFRPAKTRKRSLDVGVLRSLINYPVEPFAEIYRDMFVLSFMLLGINSIDLYNLKEVTRQGRIEYDRSKTGGIFSVKVEPEAMAIIEKYRGEKGLLCIADRWSDHRNFRHQMNAAIKRIGVAQGKGKKDKPSAGLFAEVTSYWARHTWATMAYELGISEDVISQALGHQGSGARVTEVYIRRNMDRVDEANRRVLDWVLYGKR